MANPNSELEHEEVLEAPAPQKLDPSFAKAVEDAKAEKKPGRVKTVGEKKKAAATPATPKSNGQSLPSDAKLRELAHEAAAPAADPLNRHTAAPSPFSPELFRIDPKKTTVGMERELLSIPVRRPNKFEFVRVHPTLRVDVMIIQPKESSETYLISPNLHGVLADSSRHLVSCHDIAGRYHHLAHKIAGRR